VRGARQIKAEESGHLMAVRWGRELDDERVWAIEDWRGVSGRLEQALIAAGEQVVRVAPNRMGASRRGERRPGKSDEIDALAIAQAVVKDGVQDFPAAHLDKQAVEIGLLSDHRKDLVAEPTRVQNRLRWHLLESAASSSTHCDAARWNDRSSSTTSTGTCGGCPRALACVWPAGDEFAVAVRS
jgi:transposase